MTCKVLKRVEFFDNDGACTTKEVYMITELDDGAYEFKSKTKVRTNFDNKLVHSGGKTFICPSYENALTAFKGAIRIYLDTMV